MALDAGVANASVSNLTDAIIAVCVSGESFAVVELVYNTCEIQVCSEDGSPLSVDKQLRRVCSPPFMQICRRFLLIVLLCRHYNYKYFYLFIVYALMTLFWVVASSYINFLKSIVRDSPPRSNLRLCTYVRWCRHRTTF